MIIKINCIFVYDLVNPSSETDLYYFWWVIWASKSERWDRPILLLMVAFETILFETLIRKDSMCDNDNNDWLWYVRKYVTVLYITCLIILHTPLHWYELISLGTPLLEVIEITIYTHIIFNKFTQNVYKYILKIWFLFYVGEKYSDIQPAVLRAVLDFM